MNVAIATCRAYPTLLRSDLLYGQALIDLKVNVAVLPWNAADLDAFLEQDMIVLRATWDYQDDPERYTAWLQTLAAKRAKIMNPPELAIWNNDKRHLIELANAGYLTAETTDLSAVRNFEDLIESLEPCQYVLKPIYGGSGVGVILTNREELKKDLFELKKNYPTRDFMLQRFLPEIAQGELSLIFIGCSFAHAILKTPKVGEFRVNSAFGATKERIEVKEKHIATAKEILDYLGTEILYARVDGVIKKGEFVCTELELTDPSLMFDLAPESAVKMAELTAEFLGS